MMATLCHSLNPKAFMNCHVLLSCAKDTHAGFTGHLLCALREAEFRTVLDCDREEIEKKEIEESLICIVILSKHYLSSPSGLDKLAEIVDESSQGRMDQLLLPVLYDLQLSFVRQQIYLHMNSVQPQRSTKWVQSLTQLFAVAANFTGCHFLSDGDTYEYQCIEKIVQRVSKHVASTIGLNPLVMQVIQLLYSGSDGGVHVVGICEKPIIGRKTIARSVYDLITDKGFDKCCFLGAGENLREPRLVHLMDMFSSAMVGNNHIMEITKGTLKKVFIIFEGINDPKLLEFAVGLTDWLGSGSRIIVTSLDKCLLQNHGVKRVYQVERCAETCVSCHPLPLEVVDSNSPGKTIEEFKSALDQCERISNTDLMVQNMIGEIKLILLPMDIPQENEEYGMRDAQPATHDRSRIWDPMELEYQLCSSS